MITGLRAEIRTLDLQNTKQGCQQLCYVLPKKSQLNLHIFCYSLLISSHLLQAFAASDKGQKFQLYDVP